MRKTGIDALTGAPWGTHFCQFYQTAQDLLDILVPYFKAGLENNEFCLWVTGPPPAGARAETALRHDMADLDLYLRRGQLEFIPDSQWFFPKDSLTPEAVQRRGWKKCSRPRAEALTDYA